MNPKRIFSFVIMIIIAVLFFAVLLKSFEDIYKALGCEWINTEYRSYLDCRGIK